MQKMKYIWVDGKMVPWDQAQVHVLTHALHYGSAIFEGIRAYACADGTSAVFRLEDHCKRMLNSAKILRMNPPLTAEELVAACVETLKANELKEGYVRPLSFVGHGEMGVYPGNNPVQTIVAVWPWGAYLGAEALEKGIRVKTSTFARSHVNTTMSKAKAAGNYINSISGRDMLLWNGGCHVHEKFSVGAILTLKKQYPNAVVMAHLECKAPVLAMADVKGSTASMLTYAKAHPEQKQFIVATEAGILFEMRKQCPDQEFIPVPPEVTEGENGIGTTKAEGGIPASCSCNECEFMKLNTLEKIISCLETMQPQVTIPADIARDAVKPIEKMLSLS